MRDVRTKSAFAKRGDERDQPGTRSGNEPNELSIKLSTRYSTYVVARPCAHSDIAALSPTLSALHAIAPS